MFEMLCCMKLDGGLTHTHRRPDLPVEKGLEIAVALKKCRRASEHLGYFQALRDIHAATQPGADSSFTCARSAISQVVMRKLHMAAPRTAARRHWAHSGAASAKLRKCLHRSSYHLQIVIAFLSSADA